MRYKKRKRARRCWNWSSRSESKKNMRSWLFLYHTEPGARQLERWTANLVEIYLPDDEKEMPVTWEQCLDYARKKLGAHPQNRHCVKNPRRHYALLKEYRWMKKRKRAWRHD